jgi:hypothetical protein
MGTASLEYGQLCTLCCCLPSQYAVKKSLVEKAKNTGRLRHLENLTAEGKPVADPEDDKLWLALESKHRQLEFDFAKTWEQEMVHMGGAVKKIQRAWRRRQLRRMMSSSVAPTAAAAAVAAVGGATGEQAPTADSSPRRPDSSGSRFDRSQLSSAGSNASGNEGGILGRNMRPQSSASKRNVMWAAAPPGSKGGAGAS